MDNVLDFAMKWKADAIIGQFQSSDDISVFWRNGIITFALDYRKTDPSVCCINGDYLASGRLCADYFIKKRVNNFAYFGLGGTFWSEERREGFMDEVRRQAPGATMSLYELNDPGTAWRYDPSEIAVWVISLPKPVAIMACDDTRAFYLVDSLNQVSDAGFRIPEDVMILGVGNDESICELSSPQLSSLELNIEEAGYNTAGLIDELIPLPAEERSGRMRNIVVKSSYIMTRRSTDSMVHSNQYVSKILRYIHNNITEHISVEDMVALVPMSRRLLESTFRREMDTSIYQYVINVRVEKMKDLMINGNTPGEAAEILGTDYKIIARSFKKLTGITPSEFVNSLEK
ncbi:MAG: substrate-binding domain-containing protein [Bacteroidales bacterium]|nr:substrate-binding domain-containing protein [Bacteroidales bacterium]